jgi:hypothetical protein
LPPQEATWEGILEVAAVCCRWVFPTGMRWYDGGVWLEAGRKLHRAALLGFVV